MSSILERENDMNDLKFRYISAKNFMCFGPEGIEIFFNDLGEVILVKGLNLDTGTEKLPASNGAGKSSIQDIISYGLYGKTVKKSKKLGHDSIINFISKKKLEVIIEFNDYRILRSREPDKLKIWQSKDHIWDSDTDVTPAGRGKPQEKIDGIIGLSHSAFCSVVVFDDSNAYSFLELDAAGKRMLVENLLGLDKYKEHHETAKDMVKDMKANIRDLTKDYERLQNEIDAHDTRIGKINQQEEAWKKTKERELDSLNAKIKSKQLALENCNVGKGVEEYETAQNRIQEIRNVLSDLDSKRTKITTALNEGGEALDNTRNAVNNIKQQYSEASMSLKNLADESKRSADLIKSLENLHKGTKCPLCHGTIDEQNFQSVLTHERNIISVAEPKLEKLRDSLGVMEGDLKKKGQYIEKLKSYVTDGENKRIAIETAIQKNHAELSSLLKVEKPDSTEKVLLENEIVELKKQLQDKIAEMGGSPYKEIIDSAKQEKEDKVKECDNKTDTLRQAEKELPYHEFWVEAFGDKGIRKYVVDGIIPALNARIAYWMQYLIDAKIELTFDNELTETILVCDRETDYHAMSNGEKRRINLAVSQAFAYVMMLNSGSCPSIVFLDEITGGGIDQAGIAGIYNMIFELAKERQVFVTTHNETLLNKMQGCDSITLTKKSGITKLSA